MSGFNSGMFTPNNRFEKSLKIAILIRIFSHNKYLCCFTFFWSVPSRNDNFLHGFRNGCQKESSNTCNSIRLSFVDAFQLHLFFLLSANKLNHFHQIHTQKETQLLANWISLLIFSPKNQRRRRKKKSSSHNRCGKNHFAKTLLSAFDGVKMRAFFHSYFSQ